MDARDQRAILIAAMYRIDRQNGTWLVPSQSGTGTKYQVKTDGDGTCSCPDHVDSGFCCKHIRAVRIVLKRELGMDGTITDTRSITFEEKKVYPRNRPAFNKAQSIEKHRFQELLHELLTGLPIKKPEKTPLGRKPHHVKDALFAMALKVYGTLASRRTSCDLVDAHERGYTLKKIPGMKVCSFFENSTYTPYLHWLVSWSATPLKAVEKYFAVDSTGFSSNVYESWYDHKYDVTRKKAIWTKAHIACGVKTNIITAVRILDKDAADSPQYIPLLKKTVDFGFEVQEAYADKAYLSAENIEATFSIGGMPFIHPKENTTGGVGGLFEKMFHYFQYRQEEFLDHYHQRSNVETAFSMIKKKFGANVRSKTEVAMANEALCKFLCHNLCVLNQEEQELGIDASFWGTKKTRSLATA